MLFVVSQMFSMQHIMGSLEVLQKELKVFPAMYYCKLPGLAVLSLASISGIVPTALDLIFELFDLPIFRAYGTF